MACRRGVELLGGIVFLHPVGHAADRMLNAVQAALELRIGQAHFQPRDGVFQPVQRFLMLGGALLVFDLVGGALVGGCLDLLQRVIQRIGVELGGLLDGRKTRIHAYGGKHVR